MKYKVIYTGVCVVDVDCDMKDIDTSVIEIDSIYDEKDIEDIVEVDDDWSVDV